MYINRLMVHSDKITKEAKVIQINDLHANSSTSITKYSQILRTIERETPDFIVFAGDIVDDSKVVNEQVIDFIKSLASLAKKMIVAKGNHDDLTLTGSSANVLDLKWQEYINNNLFEKINGINNIEVLLNDSILIPEHNINFIGLYLNAYSHYEVAKEDPIDFISKVNLAFPTPFAEDYFNILVSHSPKNVMNIELFHSIEILKTIDLILSGHMHNGIVPYHLEQLFNLAFKLINSKYYKNMGILAPVEGILPKIARGELDINGIQGIIGKPLTCLAENHGALAKILNSSLFLPSAVNSINILKKH